ncbi:MAG: chorismate-binding protein [Alloprevotella sp.]
MASYVFFRPPHARHITRLKQNRLPQTLSDISQLPLTGGYAICPFQPGEELPLVWLEPDEISRIAVGEEELTAPLLFPEDSLDERETYEQAFDVVSQSLQTGETEKVVLARRHEFNFSPTRAHSPLHLFVRACRQNPSVFVALWMTPQTGTWLVASPEPLLERCNDCWHSVALAGTRANKVSETGSWDHKNLGEQAVVSDFIHSCLVQTAENIQVSPVHTQGCGHLQHLATDYRFSLPSRAAVTETLSLLHPTPAVCGLPREAAMETILRAEPASRRYYAGFSGPLFLENETRLYVSLRCMELTAHTARLYAGGGIMPESAVETEWEETRRKMATMQSLF